MTDTEDHSQKRSGQGVQLFFEDGTECRFTFAYAVSERVDVTGLSLRVFTQRHGEYTFWLKAGDRMEGDVRDKRGEPLVR